MPLSSYPREHLVRAIREGGTVLLSTGKLIERVEDLPSEAELVQGDPAKEQAAAENLDAQIQALVEQKNRLARQQEESKKAAEAAQKAGEQQRQADEKAQKEADARKAESQKAAQASAAAKPAGGPAAASEDAVGASGGRETASVPPAKQPPFGPRSLTADEDDDKGRASRKR
jgi:septal ring factor EnvC (AmiA/AmiB activator)